LADGANATNAGFDGKMANTAFYPGFLQNPGIAAATAPSRAAAWDQIANELLDHCEERERLPRGQQAPLALVKLLTIRLVECCPDMARQQRAARLVRLVFGGKPKSKRQTGLPTAMWQAGRYYHHYELTAGVRIGGPELAEHAGISNGLAGQWLAQMRRSR
jgi:hypothetical protein